MVAIIIAGGVLYFSPGEGEEALIVNGETFSQEDLDRTVDQVTQELQMYGLDLGEEELRQEAIDRLIQEALLAQYADERGLDVTQEEIDDEFNELMMMYGIQSEEEFLSQLEAEGIEGRDQVDDLLGLEVQINKLIELYSEEVEVTDEEVNDAYDQLVAQMEGVDEDEIPALDEVRGEIENDLIQQKVTPLLLDRIEELREEAEIEILVDMEDIDAEIEDPAINDGIEMQPEGGEEMEIEIDPEDLEGGDLDINPEDLQ